MANGFKPSIGGKVPKAEAMTWIEKYDKENRKDKEKDTRSVFYGKDMLMNILQQEGCTGISFFFAKKMNDFSKKDDISLVLVGTTEDGKLQWPIITDGKDGSDPGAYDSGLTCPPHCSTGEDVD